MGVSRVQPLLVRSCRIAQDDVMARAGDGTAERVVATEARERRRNRQRIQMHSISEALIPCR